MHHRELACTSTYIHSTCYIIMHHGAVSQHPEPKATKNIQLNTPTTTPTSKPFIPVHRCNCNWTKGRCKQVWEQIHQNLDDGHVWKTNGYNFRLKNKNNPISTKSLAFQASVFRHFEFSKEQEKKYQSEFRIAHHHFPVNLLKAHQTRTKLLTRKKALDLDQKSAENYGYAEKINSVSAILRKKLYETPADIEKYDVLYVGGPVVAYCTAHDISNGTSSASTTKLAGSKIHNLPSPIALEAKQQHHSAISFTNEPFISKGLKSEYKNSKKFGGTEFVQSLFVKRVVNDLSFQFDMSVKCTTIFELEDNWFFHACLSYPKTKECQFFKLLTKPYTQRQFCDSCSASLKNQKRCKKRKEADAGDRDNISSHVPTSTMSPNSVN